MGEAARVLVIEDEDNIAIALDYLITRDGYAHDRIASGGPALIEVPVGEMPSIWTLIRRPPSQGPAPSGG